MRNVIQAAWGWGQRENRGNGDKTGGNTAGMGTDGTVIPWRWG